MSESPPEFSALGSDRVRPVHDHPAPELLERFRSPAADQEANPAGAALALRIESSEFTTLCPITGQPDWARIVIRYQPGEWCVESKSLKLYLGSFRNHGEFHEAAVNRICNDLVSVLDPVWLVVEGRFTPRGGIPFWPVSFYRREQSAAETGSDPLQRDLFGILEPLTQQLDRAKTREDAI